MSSASAKAVITFFIVFFISRQSIAQSQPVVKTNKGYIRGIIENDISVFKGIPYAAPPVGPLRFKPPGGHAAWKDTLLADKFGEIATQASGPKAVGSEDCLTLNLYTPKTDNKKRAVVVWVHGGSMTGGSGKGMDGHAFADHDDIVAITINYRLGVFGFLYLGDANGGYQTSGNNGVLDCIAALSWIKQNIAAFGGDPNRVTVMGESAGAKLISAVLVSPKSKGLFQQYIAESGSVQCIRDTVTAKNERLKIMRQLGLNKNEAQKLFTLPADSIMKAQAAVCAGIGGNSFFGPVYDGITISEDGYRYAAGSSMPRIRALIGTNQFEAALFVTPEAWAQQPDETILKPLFQDNEPAVYASYQNQMDKAMPYAAAVKVLTQYMYQMHSYRFAKVLAQNNIPVWMYRFDYSDGTKYGAHHAAELQYVWSNTDVTKISDPNKRQLAINMHQAWVAFIKTGNPNIKSLPQWPKYENINRQIMEFDTVNHVADLKEVFDDKKFPSAVFVIKGK